MAKHKVKEEKIKTLLEIEKLYDLGLSYYKQNNLKLAEKELVKVLKLTESKPYNKNLYVKTEDIKGEVLNSMYHLGLIYSQNVNYFNNYAKAAAIFQYCAKFSEVHKIADSQEFLNKAYLAEKLLLTSLGITDENSIEENVYCNNYHERITDYKVELDTYRTEIKLQLNNIADLKVEDIEERAEAVERIYQHSTNFFINYNTEQGLVQRLITECLEQLGNIPTGCEYSIIGLGSLAGGKMTPWSDLEFAILINEDNEEYKEYFRDLTKLLNIKVINFGETMLRGMGIEALNNFRIGEGGTDDWFWDSTIMNSGFSFDGTHPHACKLPFGRNGYNDKEDFELILTPEQMAEFQKGGIKKVDEIEEVEGNTENTHDWFKSDKHLVQSLRNVSLITGSQELLDNYRQQIKATENNEQYQAVLRDRALEILKEDLDKFSLKLGKKEEGKLLDAKRDIYRLGDRIVDALANYYDIIAEERQSSLSTWQVINTMEAQQILSLEGAQHLKEALSIATELRLNTYCHNNGQQSETMSTYIPAVDHLNEEQRIKLVEKTFHIKDTPILHHFYYVMISVQEIIQAFCIPEGHEFAKLALENDRLIADSNYNKGMVHAKFLEYDQAIRYMEYAKKQNPSDLNVAFDLECLYRTTGNVNNAIEIAKENLNIAKIRYKDMHTTDMIYNNLCLSVIANCYNNLGLAYSDIGKYDDAIKYYQKALKIWFVVYDGSNHPEVAMCCNNLGIAYRENGLYGDAINSHKQALKIYTKAHDNSNTDQYDIATTYKNLGSVYSEHGEYDNAINSHKQALKVYLVVYESRPNHPDIARIYNNLSDTYRAKGEYYKAINYCKKALAIYKVAYDNALNHHNIAMSQNNLGNAYFIKGEYDKAIKYHQKALKIRLVTYGSSNHPDVADSYNNLGIAYTEKGKYNEAISYLQLAVKIYLISSDPNHPDIARSYSNLGAAYYRKGEYEQASHYASKALKIYSTHQNHPHTQKTLFFYKIIVEQLNKQTSNIILDIEKINKNAVEYFSQRKYQDVIREAGKAIDLIENSTGQIVDTAVHTSILYNRARAYQEIEEFAKATSDFKKALELSPDHTKAAMRLEECTSHMLETKLNIDKLNKTGIACFSQGEYEEAINRYTSTIDLIANNQDVVSSVDHSAILYNRARAYQEAGNFTKAISDFRKALELNPEHEKVPMRLEECMLHVLVIDTEYGNADGIRLEHQWILDNNVELHIDNEPDVQNVLNEIIIVNEQEGFLGEVNHIVNDD